MKSKSVLFAILSSVLFGPALAAEDDIESFPVGGSVHMLTGKGGNIGVSAGKDGILIIDDKFAPLAEKIAKVIGGISTSQMKYVVNTHYHGDHTGGNAYFSEIQGSTIFAHDNVRKRLASQEGHSHAALPVVTYQQGVTFHFNDDTIKVMHFPAGHTDSDSVIWFEKANILHPGDLFFSARFPYIDLEGGGTVEGYIKNVTTLLGMLKDDTKIIPGHGDLANKADYAEFLAMMIDTAAFVKAKKAEGMSLQALIEHGLQSKYKAWSWAFITEEKWITTLYNGQ